MITSLLTFLSLRAKSPKGTKRSNLVGDCGARSEPVIEIASADFVSLAMTGEGIPLVAPRNDRFLHFFNNQLSFLYEFTCRVNRHAFMTYLKMEMRHNSSLARISRLAYVTYYGALPDPSGIYHRTSM